MRQVTIHFLVLVLTFAACFAACRGQGAESSPRPGRLQVLLLTGRNNHDWRATTPRLRELLEGSGRFEVRVNEEPAGAGPETFAAYDVLLLHYNGPRWGERAERALLEFARGGKGLVAIHAANNAFPDWPEYERLIGGAWRKGAGHGSRHAFDVVVRDRGHPITREMGDFTHSRDELYHGLTMQPESRVLAWAFSAADKGGTGREEPMAWVRAYGAGRVFQLVLGHDVEGMRSDGFAALLRRGTEWAATGAVTLPVNRAAAGAATGDSDGVVRGERTRDP